MAFRSGVESRHYQLEKVDEGVYAAIARRNGYAVCNSGIVDLGGPTLVFDTGLTRQSAIDLWAIAERTMHRPPALAANSHRHFDHLLGNAEFARVPIWGTRKTREVILEHHAERMAELTREALEGEIQELERRRDGLRSESARLDVELFIGIDRAILSEVGNVELRPPDHTFETALELPGSREAELRSFGSGHTEADAFLFLPHERVIFAGDLVLSGVQPSMGSGDPVHWLQVLDRLEQLHPERIVPGHGPVLSVEGMREVREYLTSVLDAARAPVGAPLPTTLQRWEGSVSLEENLRFTRQWLATHPKTDAA